MFTKRGKLWISGLMIAAALAVPVGIRAAQSYEEYVEDAWLTDGEYTDISYYHRAELEDRVLFNGIDVSWWQGINENGKGGRGSTQSNLDWEKLHDAGIDFALVRVASRDTEDGSLYEDTCADSHIQGALENDINVGLYIFSQALTEKEAKEEAEYVLKLLEWYDWDVTLPIVMDRENGSYKRLTGGKLTREEETNVCIAFSKVIEKAGYTPMIYANASWFCNYCELERMADNGCKIWLARWNKQTDEPVARLTYEQLSQIDYEFWQYSDQGRVDGSPGRLDVDFWYMDTDIRTENLEMERCDKDSVTLSWEPVAGAQFYRLHRYDDELGKYVAVLDTTDHECEDIGLMPGEEYLYKVRCGWNIGGINYFGRYSSVSTAITLPDQVMDVTVADRSVDSLVLEWSEVFGADGYRVYQYDNEEERDIELMDVLDGVLSCELDGLKAATEYSFRVRAFRKFEGSRYWGKRSDYLDTVTKPAQPVSFTVEPKGTSAVELSWSKVARAGGYQIWRLNPETEEYEQLAVVEKNKTFSYTDSELEEATEYNYRIRAFVLCDDEECCGEFTPDIGGVTLPGKVMNLVLEAEKSAINLTWDEIPQASGYLIFRLNQKTGKYKKISMVEGEQGCSFTDEGLKKGEVYKYKVRAYKSYNGVDYKGSRSDKAKLKLK